MTAAGAVGLLAGEAGAGDSATDSTAEFTLLPPESMASSRPQPTQFPSKRGGFASQMGSENRHGIAGHELSGSVGAHGGGSASILEGSEEEEEIKKREVLVGRREETELSSACFPYRFFFLQLFL